MNVQFRTEQFEFSAGHAPRGRGSWAFAVDQRCDVYFFVPGSMTYGEAKREVKRMMSAPTVRVFDSRSGTHVDFPTDKTVNVVFVCP